MPVGGAAGADAGAELSYRPIGGDASHRVSVGLGKPQGVITGRTRSDAKRAAVQFRADAELRNGPGRGVCPDVVAVGFCKPKVVVGPQGDTCRRAAWRNSSAEFRNNAGGCDAPNAIGSRLREPKGPGARRDTHGTAVRCQVEFGNHAGCGDPPDPVNAELRKPQGAIRADENSPGPLSALGRVYSVIAPAVEMRPILPEPDSVNRRAPSGPVVIPSGNGAPLNQRELRESRQQAAIFQTIQVRPACTPMPRRVVSLKPPPPGAKPFIHDEVSQKKLSGNGPEQLCF